MFGKVKNIRKTRLIDPSCRELFIPYKMPCLRLLQESGIGFSGLSDLSRQYEIHRLYSPLHLILYTISGKGWLKTEGYDGVLEPGTVWISPAGIWQKYGLKGKNWRILWFSIIADSRWKIAGGETTIVRQSDIGLQLEPLVDDLLKQCWRQGAWDQHALNLYSQLIAHLLHREIGAIQHFDLDIAFMKVTKTVRQNLSYQWRVGDLLNIANLNMTEGHFIKVFNKNYGETPMKLITRLRMEETALLLSNTDYALQLIADKVGYESSFSLSVAFKRHMGVSPREYRKKQ